MSIPPLPSGALDGFSDDEIDRFLANASPPEEAARFQAYLAEHPAAAAWVELFEGHEVPFRRDLTSGAAQELVAERVETFPDALRMVPASGTVGALAAPPTVSTRRTFGAAGWTRPRGVGQWIWPTAAVLVVGAVATVAAWNAGVQHLSRREAAATLTYTTANGQRANITLPDGSTVALNVASRLEVPADYGAGHHTVRLAGEALFTVVHHGGTPFTVVSGPVTIRVLGTSFVVRHYPTDTTTTVGVRDGRVTVQSRVLASAQAAEVSQNGAVRVGSADPAMFSFPTGVLTFDGMPLRDAIVMLDRWYDADIRLGDDALGSRQVAGGFTAGSLSNLVESLALMFNVRVVRDGRVLTLYQK